MYGAGECFAAAATKSEDAYRRATAVFEALRFLGTVTQGGEHPAPAGFVARTAVPADGPDPVAVGWRGWGTVVGGWGGVLASLLVGRWAGFVED